MKILKNEGIAIICNEGSILNYFCQNEQQSIITLAFDNVQTRNNFHIFVHQTKVISKLHKPLLIKINFARPVQIAHTATLLNSKHTFLGQKSAIVGTILPLLPSIYIIILDPDDDDDDDRAYVCNITPWLTPHFN